MIETLKQTVTAACMLSAAVGMLSLICPGKRLERQMHLLISLLLAVSLAVPLLRLDLTELTDVTVQELFAQQTRQMEEQANALLLAETQAQTEQVLTDVLAGHGITCDRIEAQLHTDADGRICLNKVTVECDDFAGANALLADLLGEEAEICVTQVLTEGG